MTGQGEVLCTLCQFVRGLSLAYMDAILKGHEGARRLLASDLTALLAERGVDVIGHKQ